MLNNLSIKSSALLLSLLIMIGGASADELVLITHRDSTLSLSADHLKRLYFGKISSLPNGRKVTVLVYADNEEQFQTFTKKYLRRTSQQLRSFWAKQLFTGRGNMPIHVNSEEEMLNLISSSEEYVGYIPIEALQESVRLLVPGDN